MQDDFDPYFNPFAELEIHDKGDLPHCHQQGKMQYVTFRLADSLPQNRIKELNEAIAKFKQLHPEPWDDVTKLKYHNLIGPIEEKLLDNGYGNCELRDAAVRKILSDAIWFADGDKYKVIAYVIMPNHVHMLLLMLGDNKLERVMHSIKSFSAHAINKLLGRSGELWKKENFDRLVRSEVHFERCKSYIKGNPAYLPQGDFELYLGDFEGTAEAGRLPSTAKTEAGRLPSTAKTEAGRLPSTAKTEAGRLPST